MHTVTVSIVSNTSHVRGNSFLSHSLHLHGCLGLVMSSKTFPEEANWANNDRWDRTGCESLTQVPWRGNNAYES